MAGKVYFGNTNFQTFIEAPLSGLKAGSSGYSATTNLLNGRAFVKRSQGATRTFSPSWVGPMNSTVLADSLNTIKDFADGVYGTGSVYWLDPYAIDKNILPPHFAAPGLTSKDWPALSSAATTFTTLSGTSNVYANNFPLTYATYVGAGSSTGKSIDIIIPPGYSFHFGWHATAAGISAFTAPGYYVTKFLRTTNQAVAGFPDFPLSMLAGGTTRTNLVVDGNTYSRVRVTFSATSVATTSVVGAIAQILPSATPTTGGFITGRGTSALQFASPVEIEYYSSAINNGQIGLSTTFVEVD
jgi:hypothetical protein